ncbi:hypothetical protein K437DRAFT_52073 [Tilletiaria anomala UBC 951]|uniref:Uncharacterized protein n=1 Tax=Tilletiaria anomala (strain ATCC 24038 / CBS 436.72 / UBC 951) TaxID=1037660 RepID=A0A066WKA1_TILAU|nr:uncharacterized protein K437DRAFT_52073 [Tilletiaria anomala UBC 951]KDN51449.1 hypothetical protein K437DRAFT_52073 [Tilletiaria anomala UBC 951]
MRGSFGLPQPPSIEIRSTKITMADLKDIRRRRWLRHIVIECSSPIASSSIAFISFCISDLTFNPQSRLFPKCTALTIKFISLAILALAAISTVVAAPTLAANKRNSSGQVAYYKAGLMSCITTLSRPLYV